MEESWKAQLLDQFSADYMADLKEFLVAERAQSKRIYPPASQWFEAFNQTPLDQVRVVIIGQDPYPGAGQAHGLCFSVRAGTSLPPSLQNIFQEINSDMAAFARENNTEMPAQTFDRGDLTAWATQGVFLLNTVLTVEHGKPASHRGRGWEVFTDQVVHLLATRKKNLVFMLWGSHAQRKGAQIDRLRHLVLPAPHPSPLSAHKGFFGCRHFSKCNQYLSDHGQSVIDWFKVS